MVNEIPHYYQEEKNTCGPAVMKMILERCGIKRSEKVLAKLMSTRKRTGTPLREFPKLAEHFGLNYVVMRNATIYDLKKYKKEGYVLVVDYYYPPEKVYHYSILKKLTREYVYLHDPWFGPKHWYSVHYFKRIWKSAPKYNFEKGWFFGLEKP